MRNCQVDEDQVQDYWNIFEDKLITIMDELIPYERSINLVHKSEKNSTFINNKLNKSKRLLKNFNKRKDPETKARI